MSKPWNENQFNAVFEKYIVRGHFLERPEYYPRYKSRYRDLVRRYAAMSDHKEPKILDIGGGQIAAICKHLWNDEATAVDIGGPHLDYLRSIGIKTRQWNLCADNEPFADEFDYIFFSEVIEHLPIPGHLVLEKIKRCLKPGGILICSTPNLYRIRNIVYMLLGRRIFDNFQMPTDHGLGHIIEYTESHLSWQFQKAGFNDTKIRLVQMHHWPNNPIFRALYLIGSPIFLIPLYRDNLVAIASRPPA